MSVEALVTRAAPVCVPLQNLSDAGYAALRRVRPHAAGGALSRDARELPTIAFASPMTACADDLDNDGLLDLGVALEPRCTCSSEARRGSPSKRLAAHRRRLRTRRQR